MAATSTLKLVLDDKEYSASIRSAKQGMNDLQQSLQTAGKSFTEVDRQMVDYAKAIGNMSTVAKDSKGQLREMSQTLTDLTRVYRQLTDDEKSSDFGKALSSSIKTLTDRAGEVQDAMGDVQASIKNAASDTRTFDQLSQGAQVALSGFQGLTGAAKLLGIEIGDDVQVIAKLQSAMAVMNSLTTIQNALQKESALMMGIAAVQTNAAAAAQILLAKNTALATAAGRALNLVAKANPVVLIASAAIAAGAALFALGKKEEEQVDKTKEAKKAAEDLKKEYEDLANKTVGNLYGKLVTLQASWEKLQTNGEKTQWIKNNADAFKDLGISISSIKDAEDILINNTSAIVEAITLRARASVLTKQIEASLENGITNPGSGEGFAPEGKYTIGFSVSQSLAKELADVESQIDSITKKWQKSGKSGGSGNGTPSPVAGSIDEQTANVQELQKAWRAAADDDSRLKIKKEIEEQQYVLDRMTGKETFDPSKLTALKGMSIVPEIKLEDQLKRAQETLKTTRVEIEAEINADATKVDTATLHTLLKDAIQSGIDDGLMNMTFAGIGDQIARGIDVPDEAWQKILDQYNALREQIGMDPISLDFKTGSIDTSTKEKGGSSLESSQKLVSGLSSVSSGLQQMGVKIPDGVQKVLGGIQGLMTVIQGVQSIISIFNTSTATAQTLTTNTNTAAMTALTSAVIANTAAVTTNTITPSFFAGGGVVHAASGYVGGSHFSGDLVPALLNSGELVLNQAQQGNIASQLQAASMINGGGGGGHDYVSGQNIYLGTNNYLKGSGQGQLVTTRMLRQYGLIS